MTEATKEEDHISSRDLPQNKRIGREIAFGIQQTLACWATDFIDPYVGKWYQNKYGNQEHKVTDKHTWGGEIIGDSAAFFVYMAVKRVLTKPTDAIIAGTKRIMDPIYSRMGRKSISSWAAVNQVEIGSERYNRKLDAYKEFQAENIVDSSIIATSSTLINVGTQRALGNKQGMGLILVSKLIGAAATMTAMLGLRTVLPDTTRRLDEELSDRYFSKVASGVKSVFGVNEKDEKPAAATALAASAGLRSTQMFSLDDAPITDRPLPAGRREAFLEYLHRAYSQQKNSSGDAFAQFVQREKQICDAFILALHPLGNVAQTLAQGHYDGLRALHQMHGLPEAKEPALRQTSKLSVQSIVINRRDDMLGRKKLLSDPKFLAELQQRLGKPAEPKILPAELPPIKQEELVESLVQTKGMTGREPAIHIFANAKGQIIEHKALVHAFDLNGPAVKALAGELGRTLPGESQAALDALARDYLEDRLHPAKLVVEAMRLDGPVVQEAIRRSETVRLTGKAKEQSHVEKLAAAARLQTNEKSA